MEELKIEELEPIERNMLYAGEEIEKLMDVYPCLREVCKGLQTAAYPAALFVGGALLGTLMTRCSYRFYARPQELRRLNYCVFIIGDPGTGKSFAEHLYNILAEPIEKASAEGIKAVNNYKKAYKRWEDGGKKGDGPAEPKAFIRTHPARTSNKVFITDMMNAVDTVDGEEMHLHLLSFDSELDNAINMQGESWNNKTCLELKAFHNEEDGQFFSNHDSILCNFNVYWNFIYTGTPMALKHKVNQGNIGNGFSTRLAAIPMPSSHFKMLPFEDQEDTPAEPEEQKTLRMWAERLDKTYGELPIKELVNCTYEWASRRMDDAKEDDSQTDELLLKRVPYYGINISVPFIVMRHWDEWQQKKTLTIDETDLRFCQLIMDIQFCCQRHFFGRYWDYYFMQAKRGLYVEAKRHTKLMKYRYRILPEEFWREDLEDLCGVNRRNAEKMIERWHSEGYIERIESGIYRKLYLELT